MSVLSGDGTAVHELPFHCSISAPIFSRLEGSILLPTAQHSDADEHVRPSNLVSVVASAPPTTSDEGVMLHVEPSQRWIRPDKASCTPTAKHSVLASQNTPDNLRS